MAFLILLAVSGETVALSAGAISAGDVARSIVGGFTLGYISVRVNGCPFRKHVEAGEGEIESILFIVGYYCGIVYYSLVLSEIVSYLLG